MRISIITSAVLCTVITAHAQEPISKSKAFQLRPTGRNTLETTGKQATAHAIQFGLDWLAKHQEKDGRWDCDGFMNREKGPKTNGAGSPVHDVGVTALALLAFLADGNSMSGGPFKPQVLRAVIWLRNQQDPKTGLIGTKKAHDFIYDHAIATLAMIEASALIDDQGAFHDSAQKGINYLEYHRNPYSAWRYQAAGGESDTSVTGWCVMANAAAITHGFKVNKQTPKIAALWFDQVSDPVGGRTGYTKRGGPSSRAVDQKLAFPADKGESNTAISLYCRFLLGQTPATKPEMQKQAEIISMSQPVWDTSSGEIDPYYWFFGSHALYQIGGEAWDTWSAKLDSVVAKAQRRDKNFHGSWDPAGPWGKSGGRVFATAMHTMTLQSFYRRGRVVDTEEVEEPIVIDPRKGG